MTKPELAAYKTKKQHDWNMTIESGFSALAMTIMYLFCFNELFLNGSVEDHWSKRTALSTHAISLVRQGASLPILLPPRPTLHSAQTGPTVPTAPRPRRLSSPTRPAPPPHLRRPRHPIARPPRQHLAASLYETVIYLMTDKALEFYAHHVLVVISCGSFLFLGKGHLWCCWLGLVEGSNPPLCMVTALRQIPSWNGGTVYTLSGAMLWICYVFCRVLSAPMCMYAFHKDMATDPAIARMSEEDSIHLAW